MSTDLGALVRKRYGDVARPYRRYWAPPLAAFAKPLLNSLPLTEGAVAVDLGAGTGYLASRLARRVERAIAVDLTEGMLRQVRAPVIPLAGDLTSMPLADNSVDVAISTFVLQHVRHPGVVIREAARILRPGGALGTATWGREHGETSEAYAAIERVFRRRRVPQDELAAMPTWHARVESAQKMRRYAQRAGLDVQRAWAARSAYEWDPAAMIGWFSSMGPYGRRLARLDPRRRDSVVHEIEHRFAKMSSAAFVWAPELIFLIAVKR